MKQPVVLHAASVLLLAVLSFSQTAQAAGGPPGFGFALRCNSKPLATLESIACSSKELKAQEKTMLVLVQQVTDETSGTDGDTGERINPMGKEQSQWRDGVASKCNDAACLSSAYKARISQIKHDWAEVLP